MIGNLVVHTYNCKSFSSFSGGGYCDTLLYILSERVDVGVFFVYSKILEVKIITDVKHLAYCILPDIGMRI